MFSDALDREAAWLNSYGDGLPALAKQHGGVFQIVQARWPRVPASRKTAIYVLRAPSSSAKVERFANVRSMLSTRVVLHLFWPLTNSTGSGEAEQAAFEQAIDQIITRVQGPLGDKTHGGRFLSVAEGPAGISIDYPDPAAAMASGTGTGVFEAAIAYDADDPDYAN